MRLERAVASCLLVLHPILPSFAHGHGDPVTYSYIETRLPVAVSDLTATYWPGGPYIYLFGGCDSSKGNERADFDPELFYCTSVTDRGFVFDPSTNLIDDTPDMPRPRYRHAASVVEDKIWLVGGRDVSDNIVPEVDVYDPKMKTWSVPVTIPAEIVTSDLAVFASGPYLYFGGGYDKNYTASSGLHRLDTRTLEVEQMASLKTERGDAHAVAVGKYAYMTGGFTHANWCEPHNSAERYNIEEDVWEAVNDLAVERGDKALVALNEYVFAIGGENKSGSCISGGDPSETTIPINDVEFLKHAPDISTSNWQELKEIPDNRFRFVGAADPSKNEIYLFGGQKYFDTDCQCYPTSDAILSMKFGSMALLEHSGVIPFVPSFFLSLLSTGLSLFFYW